MVVCILKDLQGLNMEPPYRTLAPLILHLQFSGNGHSDIVALWYGASLGNKGKARKFHM